MNLEGLRYAQAVWQTRSFSEAARGYGVTQPALSKGVSRLEAEIGVRLFDRTPRGVIPTVHGRRLLPMIDKALDALDTVVAEARRMAGPVSEVIRMGVSSLIGPDLVAAAVCAVTRLGDPWEVVLREADMALLRTALENDELDILLIPRVAPMPAFRHRVVAREPMGVVNPLGWPGGGPLELEDAADADYILVPDTCGLTTFTAHLFRDDHLSLRTYQGEASNFRVLDEWARMGLGAALLPMSKITGPAENGRPLVRSGVPVEIEYEVVWAGENPLVAELETFVQELIGVMATPELRDGGGTGAQQEMCGVQASLRGDDESLL